MKKTTKTGLCVALVSALQIACALEHPPSRTDLGQREGAVTCLDEGWSQCDAASDSAEVAVDSAPDTADVANADTSDAVADTVDVADAADVQDAADVADVPDVMDVPVVRDVADVQDTAVTPDVPVMTDSGVDSGTDVPPGPAVFSIRFALNGDIMGPVRDFMVHVPLADGGLVWQSMRCSFRTYPALDGQTNVYECQLDPRDMVWGTTGLPAGTWLEFFPVSNWWSDDMYLAFCPADHMRPCPSDYTSRFRFVLNGVVRTWMTSFVLSGPMNATVISVRFE